MPSPEVPDEAVDAQIDALRDRFADLEDKQGALADGDYAQIDIKGYVHDEVIDALQRDRLPLRGRLRHARPGARRRSCAATRPGDILKFNDTLPERFGERAGDEVSFQVLVKEAKRKVLPEPTTSGRPR